MIDVKTAIKNAISYFQDVTSVSPSGYRDLRLEEVEQSSDGKYWLVTLGFEAPSRPIAPPNDPLGLSNAKGTVLVRVPREYKLFRLDRATGEVVSMTVHNN
jgi:hypothetical protein